MISTETQSAGPVFEAVFYQIVDTDIDWMAVERRAIAVSALARAKLNSELYAALQDQITAPEPERPRLIFADAAGKYITTKVLDRSQLENFDESKSIE